MIDHNTHKLIEETVGELLQKLEITAEIKLEDKDNTVWVTIETAEPGILIGHRGRNLEALQVIVAQIVYNKLKSWVHLVLTVGDYRAKREEQLKELARTTAEKVIATQTPHMLGYLTAAERRIVHMEITQHPQVISESEGEGRDRRLIIKPKA